MELRETSTVGTEFKIRIAMEPIDGKSLSELEFSVLVHTNRYGKSKAYEKKDCIMIDKDTYAVPVDSAALGPGKYFITVTVFIPDTHFIKGVRKDVSTFYSGKEIMP